MIEKHQDIERAICDIMNERRLSLKPFSDSLAERAGCSGGTLYRHVRYATYGRLYGTYSEATARSKGGLYLFRLAVILEALGFQEDHPVIEKIRSLDDRFVYPPPRKYKYT